MAVGEECHDVFGALKPCREEGRFVSSTCAAFTSSLLALLPSPLSFTSRILAVGSSFRSYPQHQFDTRFPSPHHAALHGRR